MGASGAVAVLCGREAKEVKEQGGDVKQFLAEKEEEYSEKLLIHIRQLSSATLMMLSNHATLVSASAVAWLSWLIRSKTYQLRSMAVCQCNKEARDYG